MQSRKFLFLKNNAGILQSNMPADVMNSFYAFTFT